MCTYSIVKPVFALRCSGGADLSIGIKTALCHRFAAPSVVPSTHLASDMSQTITEQVQVGKHLLASNNTLLSLYCCKVTAWLAEHKNRAQFVQVPVYCFEVEVSKHYRNHNKIAFKYFEKTVTLQELSNT